jgi:hypothetical protein
MSFPLKVVMICLCLESLVYTYITKKEYRYPQAAKDEERGTWLPDAPHMLRVLSKDRRPLPSPKTEKNSTTPTLQKPVLQPATANSTSSGNNSTQTDNEGSPTGNNVEQKGAMRTNSTYSTPIATLITQTIIMKEVPGSTQNSELPIPIMVISALRPAYLEVVLESLENQSNNTPICGYRNRHGISLSISIPRTTKRTRMNKSYSLPTSTCSPYMSLKAWNTQTIPAWLSTRNMPGTK